MQPELHFDLTVPSGYTLVMKKIKILAVLFLTFLFSHNCGSGDKKQPGTEAETQIEIAVIPKGTTHEFWKSIHAGARQAAAELGVEILWKGPQKEDDRAQQITVVEDFISRGVDGIVLAPLDDRALMRPVRDAVRENIPVVISILPFKEKILSVLLRRIIIKEASLRQREWENFSAARETSS